MDANTWLQSAPAVALIDHYLHSQCIAVEALTAIRDMATNEEMRRIAAKAVAQIGEVTK